MKVWAESLPHKIPFRAASDARVIDAKTAEGVFLCSACDELTGSLPADVMVFEAMAQIAGTIAFGGSSEPGFLSAIDGARLERPLEVGESLNLKVTLEAGFGGVWRFQGVATSNGLERARARFYLAGPRDEDA